MRAIDPAHANELSPASSDSALPKSLAAGRALSYVSVACGVFLVALVAWFTFYLAGATIDSGTVYTGPVGAVFGAFLAIGILLSVGSTLSALSVRMRAARGSPERARAWLMWMAANAFFAVGVVASSVIVNVRLG